MANSTEKIISRLGKTFFDELSLCGVPLEKISEIRICVNDPITVFSFEKGAVFGKKKFSLSDIRDIFSALCEYSVHTYKNEICEGFVTFEGGIRAGICGTAIYSEEKITGIKDISALNIRIPHEISCAEKLEPFLQNKSVLIIGPPCSGKTTLLRDIAKKSPPEKKIVIIDERTEIAGVYRGIPSFDIGPAAVLNGFIKSDGINSAVRALSPEIIICDEFGGEKDIISALDAMKSGVKFISSMHASDKKDFLLKPAAKKIIEHRIFETFVFLNRKCEICEITDIKGLLL